MPIFLEACRPNGIDEQIDDPVKKAVAIMRGVSGNSTVQGTVSFEKLPTGNLEISVNMSGIPANLGNKHGLHVHQNGINDLSEDPTTKCSSAGPHFNPLNSTHGDIKSSVRHVGDFGNVVSDANGNINVKFTDNLSQLTGPLGIIGRAIVLHEGEDDLGLQNNVGSKTFGNSGPRLACGVIGVRD
nr:copper/zinc superoxide dismutase 3 [Brachionus rotundiformis]